MPYASILSFIKENNLITPGSTLIIGLSGGPDSVFLLHFLVSIRNEWQLHLIAAHLDHGWRAESGQEAEWCRALCASLGVLFVTTKADSSTPQSTNGSLEALGRKLRRTFFENLLVEHTADAIVLGHHADDQLETFFIRFIRGAHLAGLCSMLPKKGKYIRPLLCLFKEDIVKYLQRKGLEYKEDSSNSSDLFLRNRVRSTLIAAGSKVDTRFKQQGLRAINHLQETNAFIEKTLKASWTTMSRVVNNKIYLVESLYGQSEPFIQRHCLLTLLIESGISFTPSETLLAELHRFIEKSSKSMHKSATWCITRNNGLLSISLD